MSVDAGRGLLSELPILSDEELTLCIEVLCLALLDDDIEPAKSLLWAAMAESSMRDERKARARRTAASRDLQGHTKH